MTETKLQLSPQAQSDLNEIWHYTAEHWNREQANTYALALRKSLELIASMPGIGRELRLTDPPVRIHPSGQHIIVYRLLDGLVSIERIPAARQNWQELLSD